MRGISSSELFHGPFHAAFLIKASRPENTFKLSWTLNPSGAFHSPWEQKGKQRVKKEEARQREAGEEGKERRSFLSRLSSLAARWEDACTRANSKEREREREGAGYTHFSFRKGKRACTRVKWRLGAGRTSGEKGAADARVEKTGTLSICHASTATLPSYYRNFLCSRDVITPRR